MDRPRSSLLLLILVVPTASGVADPLFGVALTAGLVGAWLLRWRGAALRLGYAALSLPIVVGGWRVLSGLAILLGP